MTAPRMKAFLDKGARLAHPHLLKCFNDPTAANKDPSIKLQESDRGLLRNDDRTLSVIELGRLNLKSGHICVADFYRPPAGIEPLIEVFSPGNFPVQALVVKNSKIQAIAAVRVLFGEAEIDHLVPAWTPQSLSQAVKRHRLHQTDLEGGSPARTVLMSQEAYTNFLADIKDKYLDEFSPEPAFDLRKSPNPHPPGSCLFSNNPLDLVKETLFADGTNMFVIHNGEIACECCPNDAWFYLAKDSNGVTQSLILDFGTFGPAVWLGY